LLGGRRDGAKTVAAASRVIAGTTERRRRPRLRSLRERVRGVLREPADEGVVDRGGRLHADEVTRAGDRVELPPREPLREPLRGRPRTHRVFGPVDDERRGRELVQGVGAVEPLDRGAVGFVGLAAGVLGEPPVGDPSERVRVGLAKRRREQSVQRPLETRRDWA
jgi:hypothetical protein